MVNFCLPRRHGGTEEKGITANIARPVGDSALAEVRFKAHRFLRVSVTPW